MNHFENLFEEIVDREQLLYNLLSSELDSYITSESDKFWFDRSVRSGSAVDRILDWIRSTDSDSYKAMLSDPSIVSGNSIIGDALEQLGLMKDWSQVSENDLDNPDDYEQWRSRNEPTESEQHSTDEEF